MTLSLTILFYLFVIRSLLVWWISPNYWSLKPSKHPKSFSYSYYYSFKAYYTYGQDANNYYSDYGYQVPQEASLDPFSLSQDRTGGLEAFITAPLVVTAFIAALFGGRSNLIYLTVIKVRSLLMCTSRFCVSVNIQWTGSDESVWDYSASNQAHKCDCSGERDRDPVKNAALPSTTEWEWRCLESNYLHTYLLSLHLYKGSRWS